MPELLKDAIVQVMETLASKRQGAVVVDCGQLLKRCLTKKELRHIKFNYFRRGVVSVYVDSSSWLYELTLRKPAVLSRLQHELPGVSDIRFRLGEV